MPINCAAAYFKTLSEPLSFYRFQKLCFETNLDVVAKVFNDKAAWICSVYFGESSLKD